ncbi:TetR/AcrR family transcriptional regulator [Clostridium estertheticum]|uniref:TetR/AcrR family transcriptional regulator n=1 Tax=Clostridium estertheticum TaxID=238834 RepID=UPI0013E9724D|nr:TetR/AcrR family transcriptional regulator [Clostridium estertheticum]MBZ9686919.1 TetR/AcrR family transcriptional regulator [Clostridium estertheticum]
MPKISEEKWEGKKDEIIKVAFELFFSKGYSCVSVNDIIKEAKISKGGFYTYFRSKQEVFAAIVKRSDDKKTDIIKQIPKEMTATEKISAYIHARLNSFLEEENRKWAKFAIEFWSSVNGDVELELMANERFNIFFSDIESILREGIETGEFSDLIDINSFIYLMMSTIDGIALMASVMKQPLTEEKILVSIDVLLNYLITFQKKSCEM